MFASLHTSALALRGVRPGRGLSLFASLTGRLSAMQAVARQRRVLAGLDAARLHDLGLSADQAAAEAARPLWDLPVQCHR
jgi:uncharacterized protein YjiS (DUF1127 family)